MAAQRFTAQFSFGNKGGFGNSFGNSFGNKIFSEQLSYSPQHPLEPLSVHRASLGLHSQAAHFGPET